MNRGFGAPNATDGTAAGYVRIIAVAAGVGMGAVFGAGALIAGVMTIPAAVATAMACVFAALSWRHPIVAGWVNALLWVCACLIPTLSGATAALAVPSAVTCMMATYRRIRHGMAIAVAQLMALAVGTLLGVTPIADGPIDGAVVLFLVLAPMAGVLMSWRERLTRARMLERDLVERRRREAAAARIHDQVTNRLAYLILRIANDKADWGETAPSGETLQAELGALSDIAQDALATTRGVINTLNGEDSSAGGGDRADSDDAGDDETAMLRDHLGETAARLAGLGYRPTVSLSGVLPRDCSIDAIDLLHALIDETGNNITKHASAGCECEILLNIDNANAILSSQNTVDSGGGPARSPLSAGTGLRAKERQVSAMGGRLAWSLDGNVWRLRADVPLGIGKE